MNRCLLFLILFSLALPGYAVDLVKDPMQIENISSEISLSQNTLTPVKFNLTLPPGYHTYADSLKFEMLQSTPNVEIKNYKVTPLVEFFDKFSKKTRQGIKEKAELELDLLAKNTVASNAIQIRMTYQACSDDFCLLPTKKIITQNLLENPTSPSTTLKSTLSNISVEDLISQGSILTFLFIFFAGILTSFTPCIFPMIPITLSILGSQTIGKSRLRGFVISLFYVFGIATTYSLLGLVAAKTGTLFGSYLSSPIVVTFIALLFFVMALSMFGLFEIQVPVFIRSKLGNKKISQGYVGAYFTGLIAGIVASPCVGPVLVALLAYVAQSQKAFFGFFLLFTYAMGLGLIFIVMGTFSQLISKLPKSGTWMIKVKKIFGVILIAMAVYYVFPVIKKSIPSAASVVVQQSEWAPYSKNAVEAAKNKKVVIIDFSAEWCAACHELDKFTFGNLEVKRKMAGAVLLKVDATQENAQVTPILQKYGVVGLPTVIFIEKDGTIRKDQTLTGYEPPLDFIKRLENLKTLDEGI